MPSKRTKQPPVSELEIRITLRGSQPEIWRRLRIHSGMTLHRLHRCIQMIMEWYDYHLYEFTIRGKRYEVPHEEARGLDTTRVTLRSLNLAAGDTFTYIYDFGDGWQHDILVESCSIPDPDAMLPILVAGECAGPPEDCGGMPGFERLLEVLDSPDDPEYQAMLEWVGEDFDPNRFDVRAHRHALALAENEM